MAEPFAVLSGVLRDQRRSLVLWATALAAVTLIYVAFYPAVGGAELQSMVDAPPEDLSIALGYDRLGSAAGYLTSTVFGLLGPALLLVYGIGRGARLVAGLEEEGGLELECTAPVSRRQIVTERFLAMVTTLVALVIVVVAVTLLLRGFIDLDDVTVGGVLATALGLFLFVAAFGSLALVAGAVTGRRAVALAVGAGAAVLSYAADAIGSIVEGASWLTDVSPWSWYLAGDPMTDGIDPLGFGLLAVVVVLSAVVAITAFDRRDLGT